MSTKRQRQPVGRTFLSAIWQGGMPAPPSFEIVTGRLTRWIAALLLAFLGGAVTAQAVEYRLGPSGTMGAWLLSGPYPVSSTAGFAKDLLPPKQGETSGFRRAEDDGPVKWRGEAFADGFLELSKRCRRRGESAFYAACELRAPKAGTYTLRVTYWAHVAVWLDGKPILRESAPASLVIARTSAPVAVAAGKTHHLLVKVGSRNRQSYLRLALTADKPEVRPAAAPVTCVLRIPAARAPELLAQSLALELPGGSVVQVGKTVRVLAAAPAGWPVLRGAVTLNTKVVDGAGRTVKEAKDVRLDPGDLAAGRTALSWEVPRAAKDPKYTVTAAVLYEGRAAGELSRTLYVAEGLVKWAQDLGKRLRHIELQLDTRRRYADPDVAFARLKLEKAQLFARPNRFGSSSPDQMLEELEACGRAVTRLEHHRPRPVKKGLSEHAYISTIDDGPQPYYVYVPRQHDGRTHLPCIVYLHGYSPDLDKLNWQMIPEELLDYCDRHGYYLVAPFARSNTDFQGVGEVDVIRVFQLAARQYRIDDDRVFLFGYSMGAMGAFTVGAHYPDVWAGIISLSGRADYYLWQKYDKAQVEPHKRLLIDREFGAEMIGNYRTVPVLLYHGDMDHLARPEQSRRLHRRLKGLGADSTLHMLKDESHWVMTRVLSDDAVFRWMAKRRRNRWPGEIDFTTYAIKYRRAYWATVIDLVRWGEPIRVQARLNADKTVLEVKTQNVASLRLDLSKELVGEKPRLVVRINGTPHKVDAARPWTFDVEPVKRVGDLRKTPRLCGPVREARCRRFVLVAGFDPATRGDPDRFKKELGRFRGEVVGAASEWMEFTRSMPLIKRDADVGKEEIARANLILYGKPSNNSVLKRIADKLPIQITDAGFVFQGKTYARRDHGLVMIYPNPLNPARYVVVRSGLPYGGTLSVNHKYDLLPDFVIFRAGTDYDRTDQAVVAGHFDENWRVAERLLWRRGERAPDPRLDKPATIDRFKPPGTAPEPVPE